MSDDGSTPALYAAEQFEITDPRLPLSWIFKMPKPPVWKLTPSAWAKEGFWEAYCDDDAVALSLFRREFSLLTGDGE
jgi:hypothetical protein